MANGRRRHRRHRHGKSIAIIIVSCLVVLATFGLLLWPRGAQPTPPIQSQQQEPLPSEDPTILELLLNGQAEMVIEYGDSFDDPGAEGYWFKEKNPDNRQSLEVKTETHLDLTQIGTYTVTYSAEYEGQQVQKVRNVKVVDTQLPVITLVSNPDGYTIPGQPYQEEGYQAIDNYDGDITSSVQRIEAEDGTYVTYRVTDSSGNQTEVVRSIVFDDRIPPTLTLRGNTTMSIMAGNVWNDPGCIARDDVDGDLSANVTVSGSVNHRIAGSYVLTYTVTDAHQNAATVQRTVIVHPVSKPEVVEPEGEGKFIYLTFDDGPGRHTERLLQILDKYGVKATFFVCKTDRLDLLDDIATAGHTIGIHTKSHVYSRIYASQNAFFEDFYAMEELILQYAGVKPTISRFPGGSSNGISKKYCVGIMTALTQAVQDLGYQYFDWNIDSDDAGRAKTSDAVFNNVTQAISKSRRQHLVVLQHDINGYSVDAVERIILWGLENGYTFLPLDATSPVCHHGVKN